VSPSRPEDESRGGAGQLGERASIHASAVAIKEAGVLIRGPSGAGKSSLALALIAAGEISGFFARLIGDDRISLESRGGRLIARAHPLILGRIERRGLGILEVPCLAAAVVRLVVDLVFPDERAPRWPEPDGDRIRLDGVSLPRLRLPRESAGGDQAQTVLQFFNVTRESS
jgi:HPr kinase/phosphorylase